MSACAGTVHLVLQAGRLTLACVPAERPGTCCAQGVQHNRRPAQGVSGAGQAAMHGLQTDKRKQAHPRAFGCVCMRSLLLSG